MYRDLVYLGLKSHILFHCVAGVSSRIRQCSRRGDTTWVWKTNPDGPPFCHLLLLKDLMILDLRPSRNYFLKTVILTYSAISGFFLSPGWGPMLTRLSLPSTVLCSSLYSLPESSLHPYHSCLVPFQSWLTSLTYSSPAALKNGVHFQSRLGSRLFDI